MNRAENLAASQPRQIDPNLPVEEQFRQLNEAYIELFNRVQVIQSLVYEIDAKVNN